MAGSDEPKHMHSLAGAIVFSIHKRERYKVHLVSSGCKNGHMRMPRDRKVKI